MTEKPQSHVLEGLGRINQICENQRSEALEDQGIGGWLSEFEKQYQEGLIPCLTLEEGLSIAEKFSKFKLKELHPSQPTGRTETPVMEAITFDLRVVFGGSIENEISTFVTEKLVPLRNTKGSIENEPNKYLVMATKNILRDFVAVARMFQMNDEEILDGYPEASPEKMRKASLSNLGESLLFRGLKGKARADGYCDNLAHQEHIWMVRGLRDVPPKSFPLIGEFLDNKLSS